MTLLERKTKERSLHRVTSMSSDELLEVLKFGPADLFSNGWYIVDFDMLFAATSQNTDLDYEILTESGFRVAPEVVIHLSIAKYEFIQIDSDEPHRPRTLMPVNSARRWLHDNGHLPTKDFMGIPCIRDYQDSITIREAAGGKLLGVLPVLYPGELLKEVLDVMEYLELCDDEVIDLDKAEETYVMPYAPWLPGAYAHDEALRIRLAKYLNCDHVEKH